MNALTANESGQLRSSPEASSDPLLSPLGGEDKGEGATRAVTRRSSSTTGKSTPHLDPLPFPRGEEKERRSSVRQSTPPAASAPLLSPLGGEDKGEGATAQTSQRSRMLRKKATWAEKILWRQLRNRRFAGYKFRRQHPTGPYNLDFFCAEARLAIELDGREHGHPERQAQDRERDALLARLGIKVIRFWNYSIRKNLRSVLDTILRELSERTPHLDPLPSPRGEEKERRSSVRQSTPPAASTPLLSPLGGEDKGEGATRAVTRRSSSTTGKSTPHLDPLPFPRGEEKGQAPRKPHLKFIGPPARLKPVSAPNSSPLRRGKGPKNRTSNS